MADEFSLDLETTVPTDLSASPEDTSDHFDSSRARHFKRSDYERKKLHQEVQLLKITLSQKDLTFSNFKAHSMQRIEELEEQLNDTKHQNKLLQTRLESESRIQKEDSKRRQNAIQQELESILRRQRQLEDTNRHLQEKSVEIRNSLQDLELTEAEYHELKGTREENLTIKEYVALKLYEAVSPWKQENSSLYGRCKHMGDELRKKTAEMGRYENIQYERMRELDELQSQHQKLLLQLGELQQQAKTGDYKVENFDRIQKERDDFESELVELKKKEAYLEVTLNSTTRERDDFQAELTTLKQTVHLLKQDKEYFSRQVSEMHNKLLYAEERVVSLNQQLEQTKQAREDVYEKYVASRDQYKSEYETKLREELEQIRVRTNAEIERLNGSSKEIYERENRSLREARDMAFVEKDRSQQAERDALGKHEYILQEYRQLQASMDTQVVELRSEIKRKTFDNEQSQVLYEDTIRKLKESQLEHEKVEKKLQTSVKEYYTLQNSLERRISELQSQLSEKNVRLEAYEKLEKELDEVVLQAAEVDEDEEPERVLFSYGYGANVPTHAKRRLKQSVHLARRILTMERENTALKKEIEERNKRIADLKQEVKNMNNLLDASQQPYHYLVESIRSRDAEINKLRDDNAKMELVQRQLKSEKAALAKAKNHLSADLERLLSQKEEMAVMKQVIQGLSRRRRPDNIKPDPGSPRAKSPVSPRARSLSSPRGKSVQFADSRYPDPYRPRARALSPGALASSNKYRDAEDETNTHRPAPTHFVSNGHADWQKQLRKYPVGT